MDNLIEVFEKRKALYTGFIAKYEGKLGEFELGYLTGMVTMIELILSYLNHIRGDKA